MVSARCVAVGELHLPQGRELGGAGGCVRVWETFRLRAAPGRSWAVAVCVCVKYIIYSYLTVSGSKVRSGV